MFKKDISGTLMKMEKSNQTKLSFVVWFPFVRDHMMQIHEGSLVAVRNFSSDDNTHHYSVLRITSAMPMHYAMMTGKDGYPGFMEEAAISASKDWDQEKPVEDTTKILCDAVPSTFEIQTPRMSAAGDSESVITKEKSMPMPGEKVRILDDDWTGRIINHDLQQHKEGIIRLGTLVNSTKVDILALWDSMIRTHFGVFAYTNAGKSNLLSTLAAELFNNPSGRNVKMVVYDLMGEYGALLVDVLYNVKNSCIVCLSPNAVPDSVIQFWKAPDNPQFLESAAQDIVNTTILPKMLAGKKNKLIEPVKTLLQDGKIKIFSLGVTTMENITEEILNSADDSAATRALVGETREKTSNTPTTSSNIQRVIDFLKEYILPSKSSAKAEVLLNKLVDTLESKLVNIQASERMDAKFKITMNEMMMNLNDASHPSLYVVQDGDDANVRLFSYDLGNNMLNARRERGLLSPAVSFVYDEADQFIAQQSNDQIGMDESRQIAEQLARRGRKYGLGIGIATQRIIYLDTNILGQPHTYFVSKLPRITDRDRIQEAFGLSDETIQESLKFGVGQWLLMSHSATGIDGLPIPIQLPDANKRISDFLDDDDDDDEVNP